MKRNSSRLRPDTFCTLLLLAALAATCFPAVVQAGEVQSLLKQLKSEDEDERSDAVFELVMLEDARAVEPLAALLKEEFYDWRVYEVICQFLAQMKDPRAVPILIKVLPNDEVQMFAAMALGEIGDPRAIDGLGVLLKDEDWEDRGAAAVALGQIRSPKAVPLLIEALEDEDRSVRQDASLALAEIRTPGVTEALISVVKSTPRSTDVPLTVIEALGEIGDPRAVEAILSVVPSFMDLWNWCALVALRDIEKQTSDEADEQKLENIMMMFQTSPPDAMEELFGLLDHGNWAMKKEAMKSLMMVGGLSVAPQMEERLNHKNSDIRMLAASWFAMAAEPGSPLSETLIKTFKSKDPAVRRFAILGNDDRTDEAFIKICTEALKDEDYVVRILALRILDEHNIPELEQTVEEGRKAEPEWIQAYIEQLKKQL